MTKCVFCGKEEASFRGVHLIKNDGTVNFFCSSKCRKNALKLKRDKRKLKWTEAYRVALHKTRIKVADKEKEDRKKVDKVEKVESKK